MWKTAEESLFCGRRGDGHGEQRDAKGERVKFSRCLIRATGEGIGSLLTGVTSRP